MTNFQEELALIRSDYQKAALDEAETGSDPILFFEKWFHQAQNAAITEVNAMTLATTDQSGQPHARIVLLKGMDQGSFHFFSNYESHKGQEIADCPKAALLFFWKELERQVRIEGVVEKLPGRASDEYFNGRPKGSQIGALASPQSQVIASRQVLEKTVGQLEQQFADAESIPRPAHWGGYRVIPNAIEFWQGRRSRLHDRILFERDEREDGIWKKSRLAP